MANDRIASAPVEVIVQPDTGVAARLATASTEVLVTVSEPAARLASVTTEILILPDGPPARLAAMAVEVLIKPGSNARSSVVGSIG